MEIIVSIVGVREAQHVEPPDPNSAYCVALVRYYLNNICSGSDIAGFIVYLSIGLEK
jgi:hypothetical protein